MGVLDDISVDISVVLGTSAMPIHQLLRMGRGAVIALDATETDPVTILANDVPVALGAVILREERISVEITEVLKSGARISPLQPLVST
jgi:flagellar motor switch protein FliN/FliY